MTEEQIQAVKKINHKQVEATNNHWQKTISKQSEEVGRLRKIEDKLLELRQKNQQLEQAESEAEFADTDERIKIGVERKTVQNQMQDAEIELRKAQVKQNIPDFENLVADGFVRNELLSIARASGNHNPSESDVNKAIENLRANPHQAIFVANLARKQKQIDDLTNKNKKIVDNTDNLGKKITQASEQKIVTGSANGKPKLTHADIWNLSKEETEALIQAGRKNGSFAKKK